MERFGVISITIINFKGLLSLFFAFEAHVIRF